MKTAIEQIEFFNKHFTHEVISQESYTPEALLKTLQHVCGLASDAIKHIAQGCSEAVDKMQVASLSTSIPHDNNKNQVALKSFIAAIDNIKDKRYSSYSNKQIAMVPLGIVMNYCDLIEALDSSYHPVFDHIASYQNLIFGLMRQDPSVFKSSSARYYNELNISYKENMSAFGSILKYQKDMDIEKVAVSAVLSNSNELLKLRDKLSKNFIDSTNWGIAELSRVHEKVMLLSKYIDELIEELSSKKDIQGSNTVLMELSGCTELLAKSVDLWTARLNVKMFTCGAIYQTLVNINEA